MHAKVLLAAMCTAVIGRPFESSADAGSTTTRTMHMAPRGERGSGVPTGRELSALGSATQWLNSPRWTEADLRGKVILVDFWTYTCVNWRRTLPYVRAWAAKYKPHGLVVIGVHSPEFEFEKDVDAVRREAKRMAVDYPIVIDNDHAIWRAFNNEAWPALYFVDAHGRVRRRHLGEGEYERAEAFIQKLLAETGKRGIGQELVSVQPRGPEAAADWDDLGSPETYVGYEKAERFASPGGMVPDRDRLYRAPARLALNEWALVGGWTLKTGAAALNAADGRMVYRFHARDLNLVMGPSAGGSSVRFRLLIDGRPPGSAHGSDVDEQGNGTAHDLRLYQLIRQTGPVDDRLFEIRFIDPGAEAFAFTFG